MPDNDPHAPLHDMAVEEAAPHEPVQVGDDDWREALDQLNKTLTGRINGIRTDMNNFKQAVSGSVQTLSNDLGTAKTSIQNNTDAIQAQDDLINEAKTAANAAKKAADLAKQSADDASKKAAEVEANLQSLVDETRELETRYAEHTHDLTVTFQGETAPPKAGN